jgi:L-ascorbate metabolism protein UlaG (beta-lactamase superfamily)
MNSKPVWATILFILAVALGALWYIKNHKEISNGFTNYYMNTNSEIKITPISHATMVIEWAGEVIYTDPVGGTEAFSGKPTPDIILLTDIHDDHISPDTLKAIANGSTILVMPKAVDQKLDMTLLGTRVIIGNGEKKEVKGFSIEAVPMYNFPESPEAFHTKGRGNGYIIEANGKRVYISGDTGNIPEMATFKNIDIAFLSMNLPYTMSVEDAAKATLAMKPKQISPYHYRGPDGLSDINKFKELVNKGDPNINVVLMNFYP